MKGKGIDTTTGQLQRMERILEISRDLTSAVTLKDLLQQIVDAAIELTDSEAASLLLLDEGSSELRFVAATQFADQLAQIPVPTDGSIAGAAFASGKPVVVPDVGQDPRYFSTVEEETGFVARSLLAVPLQFKERRIGTLEVENKRQGDYSPEDVETLTALAVQATVAIENARLVEALREARDDLEIRVEERTAELSAANRALKRENTDRKLAEAMLRESTERFRQIVENAPFGYYRVGRDGAWQYVNPEWVRMHGYELQEVIGRSFELTQPEEDKERAREIVRRALAGESLTDEFARRRKDGAIEYHALNIQPVYLHKKVVAIEGFINDITERRRAEEALQRAHDELELRVQERTAELAAANEDLQREIAERKRAVEAEREQRALAEALRDAATVLTSTLDTDEVLDRILASISQVVPHDVANVLLLDADGETGRIRRTHGYKEHDLATLPVGASFRLADVPIYQQMVKDQQPVVVPDTEASPDWVAFPRTNWIRSFACAPMRVQDQVIGFLNLDSASPEFFDEEHIGHLQTFADQAAIAIQNARLYSQMEEYTFGLEKQIAERTKELQQNVELLWDEITERQRAEKELRNSRAQLRAILNSTQQAFVLFDREYRIQMFNHAARDHASAFLGIELRKGKSLRKFIYEQGRTDFVHNFGKALDGETIALEQKWGEAAGADQWFSLTYNPVRADDDQIVGVCFNLLDITDRKQAEEQVRQQRDLLGNTIEALSHPFYVIAIENLMVEIANSAARRMAQNPGATTCHALIHQTDQPCSDQDRPCPLAQVIEKKQPVTVEHIHVDSGGEQRYIEVHGYPILDDKGRVSRMIEYTLDITERKKAEQTLREAVATAERERLAGDLHDAVTQTLFSASLIAEVLPRLWEIDPTEAERNLDKLRQLTRGALAEMRTLLLELRPAALTQQPLGDLLRHLSETLTSRTKTPVQTTVTGECALPPDIQITLYRIAQESFNNIAKHAEASQVRLTLQCQPDRTALSIEDDGCGFDPSTIPPGHLGVGIMRERAAKVNASLTIDSQVGRGTRVRVEWNNGGKYAQE